MGARTALMEAVASALVASGIPADRVFIDQRRSRRYRGRIASASRGGVSCIGCGRQGSDG
jgi:hypothetical protein